MKLIEFKGKKYLYGSENFETDGFIATKHQYKNGLCGYAHYHPGVGIQRFGEIIGELKDIKVIKEYIEIEPNFKNAYKNLLTSPTWFGVSEGENNDR